MRKLLKSTISLILVLAMSLGIFPAAAFAEAGQTQTPNTEEQIVKEAVISSEDESKRGEFEKHFRLSDGSYEAVTYPFAVHYNDEGEWKDFDNTILPFEEDSVSGYKVSYGNEERVFSSDPSHFLFEVSVGDLRLRFSFADSVKVYEDAGVKITNPKEEDVPDIHPALFSSNITYESILKDADLSYDLFGRNIKECILLKSKDADHNLAFRVTADGLKAVSGEDGEVRFLDEEGYTLFSIPCGYMEDAKGEISEDVRYMLSETEDGYLLTLSLDEEWLKASGREFPVVIDPVIVADTKATSNTNPITTTYVKQGSVTSKGNKQIQYWGWGVSSTSQEMRGYARVNELPVISSNYVITKGTISYCVNSYSGSGMPTSRMGVRAITEDKPSSYSAYSTWIKAFNWNNKPSVSSDFEDYQKITSANATYNDYITWDITRLTKGWYDGSIPNYGISFDLTDLYKCNSSVGANVRFWAWSQTIYYPYYAVYYSDTVGIEPYYTYRELSAGRAGDIYIGDYTGKMTLVKTDTSVDTANISFGLSHVYNSAFGNEVQPRNAAGSGMHFGKGWTLDALQTVSLSDLDFNPYIYVDGDQTQHYFYKDSSAGSNVYRDEDGLGLKLTAGSSEITITDDKDNKMVFTGKRLQRTEDAFGNKVVYVYDTSDGKPQGSSSEKLISITAYNAGASSASYTIATLSYNSSGYLTGITDYSGNTVSFSYTNNALTRITHPDGTYAQYTYDSPGNLTSAKDFESGYHIDFTYAGEKLSTWREYSNTTAAAQTQRTESNRSVTYTYDGRNASAEKTKETILFDYAGRSVNDYVTSEDGKTVYAVSSSAYTASSSGTFSRTANRILEGRTTGKVMPNILSDGGFEGGSLLSGSSTSTLNGGSASASSAKAHTGIYSAKITGSGPSGYVSYNLPSAALTPGKVYTLSCYVNTEGLSSSNTGKLYLKAGNTSGSPVAFATSGALENGWIRISVSFTASSSNTLKLNLDKVSGIVYADDFLLEEGEGEGSLDLLKNGKAETAADWTRSSTSKITAGTLPERSGNGLVFAGTTTIDSLSVSQSVKINLPSNNSFALSAWAKAYAMPKND